MRSFPTSTFSLLLCITVAVASGGRVDPIPGLIPFATPYEVEGLAKYVEDANLPQIGKGAFGSVYRSQWPGYPNGVVIKVNARVDVATREAQFLAYLDGVGGAPQLVCWEPSKGILVMDYVAPMDLMKLRRQGFSHKDWLIIFMALTKQLNSIHRMGIVHSDLKPNNILVSTREDGALGLHIVDFGLSTLLGHEGPMSPKADWEKRLKRHQWYAPEFHRGEALDATSDAPGLAFCMRVLMPFMEKQFPSLWEMANMAKDFNRKKRPTLKEFYRALQREYIRL